MTVDSKVVTAQRRDLLHLTSKPKKEIIIRLKQCSHLSISSGIRGFTYKYLVLLVELPVLFNFDPFTPTLKQFFQIEAKLAKNRVLYQAIKVFTFKYSYRLTEALVVFLRAVLIMSTGSEIQRISPVLLFCSYWAFVRMYYLYYQLRCRMTV